MARIVACIAETQDALRLFEGVVRLRKHHGTQDTLDPLSSLDSPLALGYVRSAAGLVTDLRASASAECRRCPTEIDALRNVTGAFPDLRVIALVKAEGAVQLTNEPGARITEFVIRDQEDGPEELACTLLRVIGPRGVDDLLDLLTAELPVRYRITMARVFRPSKRLPTENDLASWAGRPVEVMRRDFRRAGLLPPKECALLVRLLAATHAARERGSCPLRTAVRFGFRGEEELHATHERLMGSAAEGVQEMAWGEIVDTIKPLLAPRGARGIHEKGPDGDEQPSGEAGRQGPPECALSQAEQVARLFTNYGDTVRQAASTCGLGEADADDVVQQVFAEFWERTCAGKLPHADRLSRRYFWTAGRNRALDLLGKRSKERAWEEVKGPGDAPRDEAEPDRLSNRVETAIRALPEPERTVFRACELGGWPSEVVWRTLKMARRTCERCREKARTRMRCALDVRA